MLTIQQAFYQLQAALQPLYDAGEATAIAHEVMTVLTGKTKLQRIADKEEALSNSVTEIVNIVQQKLCAGEPLQYVLGHAWFMGQQFLVTDAVLIPRPETEELVQWIIDDHKQTAFHSLLDIGTGSGCIPICLKLALPHLSVAACDISEPALAIAKLNNNLHHTGISFFQQDILNSAPGSAPYDCIVSNPPYIPQREVAEMHHNVTQHEPHLALFVPDNEPLLFYKAIAAFGKQNLNKGGRIYCELHHDYGKETAAMFQSEGYQDVILQQDMSGNNRMLRATLK